MPCSTGASRRRAGLHPLPARQPSSRRDVEVRPTLAAVCCRISSQTTGSSTAAYSGMSRSASTITATSSSARASTRRVAAASASETGRHREAEPITAERGQPLLGARRGRAAGSDSCRLRVGRTDYAMRSLGRQARVWVGQYFTRDLIRDPNHSIPDTPNLLALRFSRSLLDHSVARLLGSRPCRGASRARLRLQSLRSARSPCLRSPRLPIARAPATPSPALRNGTSAIRTTILRRRAPRRHAQHPCWRRSRPRPVPACPRATPAPASATSS